MGLVIGVYFSGIGGATSTTATTNTNNNGNNITSTNNGNNTIIGSVNTVVNGGNTITGNSGGSSSNSGSSPRNNSGSNNTSNSNSVNDNANSIYNVGGGTYNENYIRTIHSNINSNNDNFDQQISLLESNTTHLNIHNDDNSNNNFDIDMVEIDITPMNNEFFTYNNVIGITTRSLHMINMAFLTPLQVVLSIVIPQLQPPISIRSGNISPVRSDSNGTTSNNVVSLPRACSVLCMSIVMIGVLASVIVGLSESLIGYLGVDSSTLGATLVALGSEVCT